LAASRRAPPLSPLRWRGLKLLPKSHSRRKPFTRRRHSPRNRVYSLLTDEREFQKVVALSEAVKSGKVKTTPAAQIGREAGAAFSIFGGFIEGRNIELVPDTRLVQVWRPKYWPAGIYSIARFELKERPGGTLMVFDHTGFPADDAASLAQGWKQNYWQPMTLVLAQ
jgi:uncharacterized protein YndB with AHSA1/START domain